MVRPIARRRSRRQLIGIAVLLGLGLVLGAGLVITSSVAGSGPSPLERAALGYAGRQMIWSTGPTVRRTETLPLRQLKHALAGSVSPTLASHVNVDDLLSRFGPARQISLVILSGSFNSLPPDEGINMHGDVVVLVDARTNHPLFLTD